VHDPDLLPYADADGDTQADARADTGAGCDTEAFGDTVAHIGRCAENGRAHAESDTDTHTDTDACSCVTESRARGARIVRVRRDDRFRCVDLASLPVVVAGRQRSGIDEPTP
jgi:hypothetical protein